MSLPAVPPPDDFASTYAPIRAGEAGWRVYALQKALNSLLHAEATARWKRVDPDGLFSEATVQAAAGAQTWLGLRPDGIVGPQTQAKLLTWAAGRVHTVDREIPDGLVRGLIEGEGAGVLAATNWGVAGGVDCGVGQFRVVGPSFKQADLAAAFDPVRALLRAGQAVIDRADEFLRDGAYIRGLPTARRRQFAIRTAIMGHNWPHEGGADYIAEHGKCSSPNVRCSWLPRDKAGRSLVKFSDGVPVETRWEWCCRYAMGDPSHAELGQIVKYVKEW